MDVSDSKLIFDYRKALTNIIHSSNKINPAWCALKESHGHESSSHKLFMRYTGLLTNTKKMIENNSLLFSLVFIADLLIYYPAVFYAYRADSLNKNTATKKVSTFISHEFNSSRFILAYGIINKSILSTSYFN